MQLVQRGSELAAALSVQTEGQIKSYVPIIVGAVSSANKLPRSPAADSGEALSLTRLLSISDPGNRPLSQGR
jgi:hypothetical protein